MTLIRSPVFLCTRYSICITCPSEHERPLSERQQQPQAQENGNANIDADINADENVSKKQKKKEKRGKNKQQETVENAPQQTAPAQPKAKQNSFDTSGLMPLDEIKPPKLDGSYSIHSEYDYGDSYGDSSVQF